jgi:hypothetical protein
MFKHDSTGVDPDVFSLLPEGWYPFRIFDAEELRSSKGNNMVFAKCEVFNDEKFNGEKVWHYVVFLPKENRGAGISVHFRKCIGVPFGGDDIVDANEWKGKKFMGKVAHSEYVNKEGNRVKNCKIVEVSPLDPDMLNKPAVEKADEQIPF